MRNEVLSISVEHLQLLAAVTFTALNMRHTILYFLKEKKPNKCECN